MRPPELGHRDSSPLAARNRHAVIADRRVQPAGRVATQSVSWAVQGRLRRRKRTRRLRQRDIRTRGAGKAGRAGRPGRRPPARSRCRRSVVGIPPIDTVPVSRGQSAAAREQGWIFPPLDSRRPPDHRRAISRSRRQRPRAGPAGDPATMRASKATSTTQLSPRFRRRRSGS